MNPRTAVARGQLVIREVEEHKPEETFWLAWRTGEDGAALRWWRERLRRPPAAHPRAMCDADTHLPGTPTQLAGGRAPLRATV